MPVLEKKDIRSCVLLILLLGTFCLPLLTGWEKMFYDDIACFFYPQQAFVSRALRQGAFPWWDPHTFCGAKPYYAGFYQSSLYPLQWPFLLFSPGTPAGLYFWTVKVPMALHLFISALGGYLFGRLALGFRRVGAIVSSLAYTLSPSMTYMAATPTNLFAQAWLPFMGLFWLGYARLNRRWWVPAGIITVALASPSGDMPFIFQNFLNLGLLGLGYVLLALAARRRDVIRRLLIGGTVIFGGGMLLSGLYWVNMSEGLSLLFQTPGQVSGFTGIEQSLYPAYLVTLLFPDFFGGVTSHHTWGAAWKIDCSLNDANLLGGMSVLLVVFLALTSRAQKPKEPQVFPSSRGLQSLFGGMCLLSLLVVLGRYTQIYAFLSACPAFSMPYPIRYRVIECFALAGLLGASVSFLLAHPPLKFHGRVYLFVSGAVLLFGAALLIPYPPYSAPGRPGCEHLSSLDDWRWFVGGPLLIGFLYAVMILLASVFRPRLFVRVLVVLVVGEILLFGYLGFYRNLIFNRRIADESGERFGGPEDHPFYTEMKKWEKEIRWDPRMFRRGCYRSILSNISWYDGSLSALGFDSKPLVLRFMEALAPMVDGFPYELRPKQLESRFWPNQSVREFILPGRSEDRPTHVREISGALPRAYLQPRWTVVSPLEQREALWTADLRMSGFCDSEAWESRPPGVESTENVQGDAEGEGTPDGGEAVLESRESPNRLCIRAHALRPCMLVITDAWHPGWLSTVDGISAPIFQVNYCQRGIWLEKGEHVVEMFFRPPGLKVGLSLSSLGLLGLFLVGGCAWKKLRGRGPDCVLFSKTWFSRRQPGGRAVPKQRNDAGLL